jgi:hypothetical protein
VDIAYIFEVDPQIIRGKSYPIGIEFNLDASRESPLIMMLIKEADERVYNNKGIRLDITLDSTLDDLIEQISNNREDLLDEQND